MGKLRIVQIGESDWSQSLELPQEIEWFYARESSISDLLDIWREAGLIWDDESVAGPVMRRPFQLAGLVVTSPVKEESLQVFQDYLDPYTTFLDEEGRVLEQTQDGFVRAMRPQILPLLSSRMEKLQFLAKNLFSGQYGAKLKVSDIDIHPQFSGSVQYDGNVGVEFSGHFGEDYSPLFTFRYNLVAEEARLEIWPEYIKTGPLSLRFEIVSIRLGSVSDVMDRLYLYEEDFTEPVELPEMEGIGYYSISVSAKGEGSLKMGPCHWRRSRNGLGRFILGGQRMVDAKRQEIFSYFHPGDLKPPLNVYFSGYRPAEGFEGFFMMKSLGAPFLLLSDPRLEGGCFYSGTEELESQIVAVIQESLDYLGFTKQELVLSGLSMGAFGGLYYSAMLEPHAVIVGKPFTNLGDVVTNLKLKRPDEFETSADMLRNVVDSSEDDQIKAFNLRFWEKFSQANLENTKFAIAYMEQDDYDPLATIRLIDFLAEEDVHIFAKGYEGRHNDNSISINKWFMTQYQRVLSHDFGRS
ncbi:TPA: accessory Sec system protein Asp2 [Streptococcus suis]